MSCWQSARLRRNERTSVAKRYWLCPSCKTRNERTKRKCVGEGCKRSRPAPRKPKHAVALDRSYEHYIEVAELLHGIDDESCCVCRTPRSQHRRHDRDHDHKTGLPRGLLCVRHNQMLDSRTSPAELRALAEYLERAAAYMSVFNEGVEGVVAQD
jgi:hypothetical protein